jgi:hypothetical protein
MVMDVETVETSDRFKILSNETEVIQSIIKHCSIILVKPVQSGKTSDVFKIVETTYKNSATIFVSDKNSALAGQTNVRAKIQGFTVLNFNEATRKERGGIINDLPKSVGKKKIFHFLMEVNNLDLLYAIVLSATYPITLIIDEGDKNRNVADFEESDNEGNNLPIITRKLLTIKNRLKKREDGSKVIFVTATPQSLLVSEKDPDRLVVYKEPYKNYIGAGLDHEPDVEVIHAIRTNPVPASERWSNSSWDVSSNSFRHGVDIAIDKFKNLGTKDPTVKQILLISLESRNASQSKMGEFVKECLQDNEDIDIIIFNGETKKKQNFLLSDLIGFSKKRKIVIIAGFMAARGVSFTDFSDPENKYELVIQVHNTKEQDPLNSSLQAMRIFGPARRTVTRPFMICNSICAQDLRYNFVECYRVIHDLALGLPSIDRGAYDISRPLTQKYNFRYMLQSSYGRTLLFESPKEEDHMPVNTWGSDL